MKECPHCYFEEPKEAMNNIFNKLHFVYCPNCSLRGPHGIGKEEAEKKWDSLPRTETYTSMFMREVRAYLKRLKL